MHAICLASLEASVASSELQGFSELLRHRRTIQGGERAWRFRAYQGSKVLQRLAIPRYFRQDSRAKVLGRGLRGLAMQVCGDCPVPRRVLFGALSNWYGEVQLGPQVRYRHSRVRWVAR